MLIKQGERLINARNWNELVKPDQILRDEDTASSTHGKFVCEPLERGYGTTIGNAMRRVLLASLQGAAFVSVKITGVQHEFTTIHGVLEDVTDVVYVKTDDRFSAADNPTIAREIEKLNKEYLDRGTNYVLVGPGRWGSSDSWLGIPVKWPHISAARVIVEVALKNYRVDPSQGTHFFQNLTSFGVGYFTIDENRNDGCFHKAALDAMPAVEETEHVRVVRFEKGLRIMMDGKKGEGVVVAI